MMCLLGSPGKGSMWQQELGGCMSWAEPLGRCCPSAGNAELRRDVPKTVGWEWLLALAKSSWVVVMFGQHLCPANLVWDCGVAELMEVTSLLGLFLVLCSQAAGWTPPHFFAFTSL